MAEWCREIIKDTFLISYIVFCLTGTLIMADILFYHSDMTGIYFSELTDMLTEGVWPLIYSLWIAGIMGGRMEMEVRGFMPGEWITIARRLGMGVYELRTMRGRQYIAERINQDIEAYECPYEPIIVNIDLVLLSVITILIIIALGAIINRLSNKTWKIY